MNSLRWVIGLQVFQLMLATVTHVSGHLSPMSPVHTRRSVPTDVTMPAAEDCLRRKILSYHSSFPRVDPPAISRHQRGRTIEPFDAARDFID